MRAPLAFVTDLRSKLVDDLHRITADETTHNGMDMPTIHFDLLLDALLLESPEDIAIALTESLDVQKTSNEAATTILLALHKVVRQNDPSGNAEALEFLNEVFARACIAWTRKVSRDAQRVVMHQDWIFDHLPAMMHSIDDQGRLTFVNERWLEASGYSRDEVLGRRSTEFLTPESARYAREVILPEYFKTGRCDNVHYQFVRKDGSTMDIMLSAIADIDAAGRSMSRAIIIDVSKWIQSQLDAQKASAHEETIRIQRELLRAISTPLVPLGDGILLMPLVGNIDSARADQIMSTLLDGVVTHSAEVAILDVTGVPTMDAAVAEALIGATKAVGLLGAGIILTGVGPAAARTLVELNIDLGAMTTKSTLRDGLATARKRLRSRHA